MKRITKTLALCVLMVLLISMVSFAKGKIELTVQTYWDPELGSGARLEQSFKDFMALYPNIEVKHIYLPRDQLIQRVLSQVLTDTLPDIVFADNPWVRQWAEAGVYKDITPLVEQWDDYEDFFHGTRDACTFQGRAYALQLVTNNLALFYNKDMFAELGIAEPPKTWDDIKAISAKVTANLPGVYGLAFSAWDDEECTWQFEPFIWSNKGSLLELDQPEAVAALQFWTDLVNEGYTARDCLNWRQQDVTHQLVNKKVAMMVMGPWEIRSGLKDADFEYGIVPIPVPKAGYNPVSPMGGECFGLSSSIDPSKIDAAWQLIEYLVAPEHMADFTTASATVPTRGAALEFVLDREPRLEVFAKQAEYALARTVAGGGEKYPEVSAITRSAIQRALSGMMDPQAAFTQAAGEIKELWPADEYEALRNEVREVHSR
ncbi:MAG: sugar ABC transporter substrate-binding protein [Firmicutes bacterium]|nr:sugar ABC transporter substrate-binding protein [Bacillota bacterium]